MVSPLLFSYKASTTGRLLSIKSSIVLVMVRRYREVPKTTEFGSLNTGKASMYHFWTHMLEALIRDKNNSYKPLCSYPLRQCRQ